MHSILPFHAGDTFRESARNAAVTVSRLFAAIGLCDAPLFLNGFTVSRYALKTRSPILKFWRDGYLWTWSSFLAAAIATGVVYSALSRFGLVYVLLSLPIIAVTFWSYKVYFEKINAKTREAEEMSQLHLSTVRH